MKINSPRRRKAISPVLATVILIAITLIAAIAIAGFVFGLFGTFTSGQNLQLVGTSCYSSTHTGATTENVCVLSLTNTGGASASITACSIYGNSGVSYGEANNTPLNTGAQATKVIAAGTTSASPAYVDCFYAAGLTAGAAVTGSLTVASGSPLAFSSIAA